MPLFKSAARHFKISRVAELAFDKACGRLGVLHKFICKQVELVAASGSAPPD
jgi:hypothetical protein